MSYRLRSLVLIAACLIAAASAGCNKPSTPVTTTTPPVASATATPSVAASAPPAGDLSESRPATPTDAGAIATTLTVTPGGSKKPAIGSIARPSDATIITQGTKILASDQGVKVTSVKIVSTTQDKKGQWWILLSVVDPDPAVNNPLSAVVTFNGKKWDDPIYGEVVNTDLPPDVKF